MHRAGLIVAGLALGVAGSVLVLVGGGLALIVTGGGLQDFALGWLDTLAWSAAAGAFDGLVGQAMVAAWTLAMIGSVVPLLVASLIGALCRIETPVWYVGATGFGGVLLLGARTGHLLVLDGYGSVGALLVVAGGVGGLIYWRVVVASGRRSSGPGQPAFGLASQQKSVTDTSVS